MICPLRWTYDGIIMPFEAKFSVTENEYYLFGVRSVNTIVALVTAHVSFSDTPSHPTE